MNKKEYTKKVKELGVYKWEDRPMSWSQISSFEWDKEQWYQKYYLNLSPDTTAEMEFGKKIGRMLETNPKFLPMIPRHNKMEHPFVCKFGKIPAGLIGYGDTFCDITFKKGGEFKTGKKAWDQKRADEHGQITMYLLMNYIMTKVKPEEVDFFLAWMPTQDNGDFSISFVEPIEKNIKIFKTKRTMMDILQFGKRINNIHTQMLEYIKNHD